MRDQLDKNVSNVYDLFSLCCSYIFCEIEKEYYDFIMFDCKKYYNISDLLLEYISDREDKGEQEAFGELRKKIKRFLCPSPSIEKCYAVIYYIDDMISVDLQENIVIKEEIYAYESISEQYKNKVRILPRENESMVSKMIDKNTKDGYHLLRDKRDCFCSHLDRYMLNYSIWDMKMIEEYPFMVYKFTDSSPVTEYFRDKTTVTFVITPFTEKKLDDVLMIEYECQAFWINGMYESVEIELKKKYVNTLMRCKEEDIDILMYPEMLMTEGMITTTASYSNGGEIPLIVNGSIWSGFTNRTIVTNGKGREIFTYLKKEPYLDKKKGLTERLDFEKNKTYAILEIKGLGRIGVCICKDLINEKVKLFHKLVGTDWLLVPTYTASEDLQSAARELSTDYNCFVITANACSALKPEEKRIGFLTIPSKTGKDRTSLLKTYERGDCEKECKNECRGKKITIDFGKTMEEDNAISFMTTIQEF